ncbi:hypothetical protein GCM10009837_19900 [Streptomyces durmitorensis]
MVLPAPFGPSSATTSPAAAPNCPAADCRRAGWTSPLALVPDAVSRTTEVGLAEISSLGVHLVPAAELAGHLPRPMPDAVIPAHAEGRPRIGRACRGPHTAGA